MYRTITIINKKSDKSNVGNDQLCSYSYLRSTLSKPADNKIFNQLKEKCKKDTMTIFNNRIYPEQWPGQVKRVVHIYIFLQYSIHKKKKKQDKEEPPG